MFAYCSNDPVNLIDPSEEGILGVIFYVLAVVIAGGAVACGIISYNSDTKHAITQNLSPDTVIPKKAPPKIGEPKEKVPDYIIEENGEITFFTSDEEKTTLVDSYNDSDNELTTGERIMNAVSGAIIGASVGGAAITLGAVGFTLVAGVTAVGMQCFAIGLLAFNATPIFLAPFAGIEMEVLGFE